MKIEKALDIHRENIEEFERRLKTGKKQRENSVDMLAELITDNENGSPRDIYRSFCRSLPSALPRDKAALCQSLSNKYSEKDIADLKFEAVPAGAHGKIAIVKNRYNEMSFSSFSKLMRGAKALYATSFNSACEDVLNGKCQFCVLPVENSQSGRLFGFYSAIDRYELKICAICEVETEGSQENVKYALVGKVPPDRIPKGLERCLEFSIISDSCNILSDILEAAGVFGAELTKIDSLPIEYRDGLQKYYFTFRVEKSTSDAFNLYLSEEYANFSTIGYYPIIRKI